MASSDRDVKRKMSGRKRPFQTNSRQPEDLSRFKDDKHKPDQETAAPSDKDVESKKCQGPRLPRNHGVNGRASQAVRDRSYRLSLFFMGFPPQTSVTRLARALLYPDRVGSLRGVTAHKTSADCVVIQSFAP